MKIKQLFILFLWLALVGGNSYAQGIRNWKYLPRAVTTTPKIPAVINPKLPLTTSLKLARLNPALSASVTRLTAQAPGTNTLHPIPADCPAHLAGFLRWIDTLPQHRLISSNTNTQQAVSALRQAILNYHTLSPTDQARVNWLVISLNKMRPQLKKLPNGNLQSLLYIAPVPPNSLPHADLFQIQLKQNGLNNPFFRPGKKTYIPVKSFLVGLLPNQPQRFWGILFFQDKSPQLAREELLQVFQQIIPAGFHIRMGVKELGLIGDDRTKFRAGKLHLHVETPLPKPDQFPMHISMQLLLSVKPYAGLIDMRTRQIVIPNNDQTIARNYLALFEPFLDDQARAALQTIIEGNDALPQH